MLHTITTTFTVSLGVAVGLTIMVYATYITLFPLVRTLAGGFHVLANYRPTETNTTLDKICVLPLDVELGMTMADGGDTVTK